MELRASISTHKKRKTFPKTRKGLFRQALFAGGDALKLLLSLGRGDLPALAIARLLVLVVLSRLAQDTGLLNLLLKTL